MARFFINTGDGIEFATTEEESRKVANEAIEFWRNEARRAGEWGDEVGTVYWGRIVETAKFRQIPDAKGGDYVLTPH